MVRQLIFSVVILLSVYKAMAEVPISALPAASSVADADIAPIVQGGVTKKAAASLIRQIVISNITDSTTIGRALIGLANPGAVRFIRINADNSATARTAAEFLSDIGGQTSGSYMIGSNNLSEIVSAATSRTNLGATTVGANLFTIADPSAVRFVRVNADNTVSLLDAATFLSAIGGGAGGGGSSIILDLADDGSNESAGVTEIAVTGDTNGIFSEPSADKLLISVGTAWPLATNASFADPDSNFVATTVSSAISELDDLNGGGPNASDAKVDWSQLANMPPGFLDGVDDAGGVGGGDVDAIHDNVAGEIAAITDKSTPVIGDHLIIEDSAAGNVKKDITIDSLEVTLESIMDLQDMQGSILDGQVPNNITVDLATAATTLQTARTIGGVSFNGSADVVPMTAQIVDSTDSTSSVALFDSATGNLQPKTDAGITYDASTGTLSATLFSGPLSGNSTTTTTASTGDTATAFFSTGLIERSRGGIGADSSTMGIGIFGSDVSNNLVDIDTIAELETAVGGANILISTELDSLTELNTLVGVSLLTSTGNGSGLTGITGPQVAFADTDDNWTATNVQAALEELDNVINGGLPNATAGKVDWSQITNVPAGFADGADDSGAGGGDADAIHDNVSGEITAVADKTIPVAADHLLIEDSAASSAKKDITVGSQEAALEGVMDLQDMQGAVVDSQVPNNITVDLATATSTITDGDKGDLTVSTGIWNIDGNVIGAAEIDENDNFDWTGIHIFDSDGIQIDDTNASHQLTIKPGSDLTANRIFTLTTGDVNRTLTLTSDASLGGTNTGDVTLAGTPDYITISGQVITRSLINLTSHVTGDLPFANLAQGSALSVLGVAGNATADNASIAASLDGQVLRRSGTTIGFGAIDLASANAVTGLLPDANIAATIARDSEVAATYATITSAIQGDVSGEIAAITDKATPVIADHILIEDSAAADAKKDITVGSQETALEGVMDLQDMQGAVTDAQVPNNITITNLSGTNTGDVTLAGTPDYITISGQTVTRGLIDLSTDVTGALSRAQGGLGYDTSGFTNGLLGSDGSGVTVLVDTPLELANRFNMSPSAPLQGAAGGAYMWSGADHDTFVAENTMTSSPTSGANASLYQNDGAALAAGDRLGGFVLGGSISSADLRNTAAVSAFASENWTGSVWGTRLAFQTTLNGGSTITELMALEGNGLISFGGSTSSFPALKRSSTTLQTRLADDSAYAPFEASTGTFSGAVSATTFIGAGGGLTLDASGFNGNLATTDNTLQEVAQKLDDLTAGSSDIDSLSATTESGVDADDVLLVSVDGTESKITLDNVQDWIESLSLTFSTINVTTLNAGTLTGPGGDLTVVASGFNGNLTTTDDTIQEVAQKLDDLSTAGDIESIGDVLSGSAFNGTQGTVLTFNDPDGDITLGSNATANTMQLSAPLDLGSAGVRISGDGDGAITFLGLGNGTDEDLTINLDDNSNQATISSSTGLNIVNFSLIDLQENGWAVPNTGDNLGVFASTTSGELQFVISNETGTGSLVFANGNIEAGTATTASANDNDTSIATTAYVQTELTAYASDTVSFSNKSLDSALLTTKFNYPNATTDATLSTIGDTHFNTTDEQLSFHTGSDGEVTGEVSISMIRTFSITFDPAAVCAGTIDRLFLFNVGDDAPEGIVIDEWKISFTQDPTTELDADLKRADAPIGVASAAVMDALDTTAGVASEDTDTNINSGATIANGQWLYVEFGTAYVAAGEQITLQIWYHNEED